MTTTTGIESGVEKMLNDAYHALVKAGKDSVRAAWRFGQCLDSATDRYYLKELAEVVGVSAGTVSRYLRFYRAYQRPELAIKASEQLESANIDLIWGMQMNLMPQPVEHRSLAGRKFRYTCHNCHSNDIGRIEVDPDTLEPLPELVGA